MKISKNVDRDVPCNGCTLCCHGDAIFLHPEDGDDIQKYRYVIYKGRPMLDHKADGSCIYLDEAGCSIHKDRPSACRTFDCREFIQERSRSQLRRLEHQGMISAAVLKQGRLLLGRIKK